MNNVYDSITEFVIDDDLNLDFAYEQDLDLCNLALHNSTDILYPEIIRSLTQFIEDNSGQPLIDLIIQFSSQSGLDVRLVGDAIADDNKLKEHIMKDREYRGSVNSDYVPDVDW